MKREVTFQPQEHLEGPSVWAVSVLLCPVLPWDSEQP